MNMDTNGYNIFFKKQTGFVISLVMITLVFVATIGIQCGTYNESAQIFLSIFLCLLTACVNLNWGIPGLIISLFMIVIQFLLYIMQYFNSRGMVSLYMIGIALLSLAITVMSRLFMNRVDAAMNSLHEKFEKEQTRRINSETRALIEDTVRRTSLIVKHDDVKPDVSDVIEMSITKPIDTLTTLPNRDMLIEQLDNIIEKTIQQGHSDTGCHTPVNIIYIMVEDEQRFSKALGHRIVDLFIQAMAHKLRETAHPADIVGRISRNEFAIVTNRFETDDELNAYIDTLKETMLETETSKFRCGVAQFPRDGRFPGELMHYAEVMMRDPSRKDEFYSLRTHTLDSLTSEQVRIAFDRAIANNEISMVYQPRFNSSRELTGFEAFMRWNSPEYGLVDTREFLVNAERTGHIFEIGRSCMNKSLALLSEINKIAPTLKMTINLSITEIRSHKLPSELAEAIRRNNCNVSNVIVDIPEEGLQCDLKEVRRVLEQLSDMDIKMSLDNFGRGYSSLNNVPLLPVSLVKLDSYFTSDMHHGSSSEILTRSIIEILTDIDIPVDATGVGSREQFDSLVSFGCAYFQGKFLCDPMPAGEVLDYVRNAKI